MKWAVFSLAATVVVAAACGARTGLDVPAPAARGGGGQGGRGGQGGIAIGGGGHGGSGGTGGTGGQPMIEDCADAGVTFVYVVTADRELYAFDPTTNGFTDLGNMPCAPTGAQSMAVDRSGHAYVESNDYRIYRLSLADPAACKGTPFSPSELSDFGMAFSADESDQGEKLYLVGHGSGEPHDELVTLDVDSFKVHPIGAFSKNVGDAELTGTGDGRLYAFGVNGPNGDTHLARIDKHTAEVLDDVVLPFTSSNAWAFAWWGGVFYFFTSNGGPSDVRRYDPSGPHLATVATAPGQVVGAGVSTCAPLD